MKSIHAVALALVAVLTTGVAQAQDSSGPSASGATPQTSCLMDDRLSVWLSLETADRMIASLEKELRELTGRLAKQNTKLKLMDEGKVVSEGLTLTKIGVLMKTETGGREALSETYEQIETRLNEVNKTLKRRRLQRARQEEWLDLYLGISTADGS